MFGSDGFRSEFGKDFMTLENIQCFSRALGAVFFANGWSKPIAIATDTRASGQIVKSSIVSTLNYMGINVVDNGILPSPALSKVLESNDFSMGLMVTASHNPHQDNGIKLFSRDGRKMERVIETSIEENLKILDKTLFSPILGSVGIDEFAFERYTASIFDDALLKSVTERVLIDCANGATSALVNTFRYNSNFVLRNVSPTGFNINLKCGALEPDSLQRQVVSEDFDVGASFDGDGDRVVFATKEYGVLSAEQTALLFYQHLSKKFFKYTVIASEIVNHSFAENLRKMGGNLIEVDVGDRFVINEVDRLDALFGFEPSGHFYLPHIGKTMDGLASLSLFLETYKTQISSRVLDLTKMESFGRVTKNYDLDGLSSTFDLEDFQKKIYPMFNSSEEKLIIRQSMWDPVIRVYYDFRSSNRFSEVESFISAYLRA